MKTNTRPKNILLGILALSAVIAFVYNGLFPLSSGQVVDGDERPIIGANVRFSGPEEWLVAQARTDSDGHYRLRTPVWVDHPKLFFQHPSTGEQRRFVGFTPDQAVEIIRLDRTIGRRGLVLLGRIGEGQVELEETTLVSTSDKDWCRPLHIADTQSIPRFPGQKFYLAWSNEDFPSMSLYRVLDDNLLCEWTNLEGPSRALRHLADDQVLWIKIPPHVRHSGLYCLSNTGNSVHKESAYCFYWEQE